MNNQHEETKKILKGLLIGAVGVGALYCIYAAKHQKSPLMKKVGQTISGIGEMIENCDVSGVTHVADSVENKLSQGTEALSNLSEWISTGISLWEKNRK